MIRFSVFTKTWKTQSLDGLGEMVAGLGFDGVELPVRPGYQVPPEEVTRGLPEAVRGLGRHGVEIISVAGPADEATISACGDCGVPIIRIMARVGAEESYLDAEARLRREYDGLLPALEEHGVTLGVQNHCGRFVPNALGLRRLLDGYDPRYIAAVWDPAHEALEGMAPDLALDLVWGQLCMVNLKNAFRQRTVGPEAELAAYRIHWTSGRQGLTSWPAVASELKRRGYDGPICLCAEYSDEEAVDRLIAEDMAFAQALLRPWEAT